MKILQKNIELKLSNGTTKEKLISHLTLAFKAAKKQRIRQKFPIYLLFLLFLINGQNQDHFLALDHSQAQDLDQIQFLSLDLDLAQDLSQLLDQDQGQNLCHGIIVEENGSKTPSITELAAGSWPLFVSTAVSMANVSLNGKIVMKKMGHLTTQGGHPFRQTVEKKHLPVSI